VHDITDTGKHIKPGVLRFPAAFPIPESMLLSPPGSLIIGVWFSKNDITTAFAFLEVVHDKIPDLWIVGQAVDDIFCYFDYLDIK
jgi:hypothetical protein